MADIDDLLRAYADPRARYRNPLMEVSREQFAGPFPTIDKLEPRYVINHDRPESATARAEKGAAEGLYGIARTPYDIGRAGAEAIANSYAGKPGAAALNAGELLLAMAGGIGMKGKLPMAPPLAKQLEELRAYAPGVFRGEGAKKKLVPAVEIDGEVWLGWPTHSHAVDKWAQKQWPRLSPDAQMEKAYLELGGGARQVDGYVSPDGKFLDRKQAADYVNGASVVNPNYGLESTSARKSGLVATAAGAAALPALSTLREQYGEIPQQ